MLASLVVPARGDADRWPGSRGSPCATCSATPPGFPQYKRTFFGGAADNCEEAAARGLSNGAAGPARHRVPVQQHELLRPRPGHRGADGPSVRVGDPGAGAAAARHRRHAHGRHLRRAAGRRRPPDHARAHLHGGARRRRCVDRDTDRPGGHHRRARPHPARVAPAVGGHGRPDAGASARHPLLEPASWYGLGLRVWADGTWGHTGTVENARSMVIRRPDGITWAVTDQRQHPVEHRPSARATSTGVRHDRHPCPAGDGRAAALRPRHRRLPPPP